MTAAETHAALQAELSAITAQIEATDDVTTLAELQARRTATETLLQRAAVAAENEMTEAIRADLEAAQAEYEQFTAAEATAWQETEATVKALHEQITAAYAKRNKASEQRTAAYKRVQELKGLLYDPAESVV